MISIGVCMHICCVYLLFFRSSRYLIYLEFAAMDFFLKVKNASTDENSSDSV